MHHSATLRPRARRSLRIKGSAALAVAAVTAALGAALGAGPADALDASGTTAPARSQLYAAGSFLGGMSASTTDAAGNVYLALAGSVIKVDPATDARTEVADLGSAGLAFGIAVDGDGNVFVTDDTAGSILEVASDGSGGYESPRTIATGLASGDYAGIALDTAGDILWVGPSGGLWLVARDTAAASGYADKVRLAAAAEVGNATAVAVDADDRLFVAGSHRSLYRLSPVPTDADGYGDPSKVGAVPTAYGIAVDASDNIYVGNGDDATVVELRAEDGYDLASATVVAGGGSAPATEEAQDATSVGLGQPFGLSLSPDGTTLYFADGGDAASVDAVDLTRSTANLTAVARSVVRDQYVSSLAEAADGTVYVAGQIADTSDYGVLQVDGSGVPRVLAGGGDAALPEAGDAIAATDVAFGWIGATATDAAGNVYIGDWGHAAIAKVTPAGTLTVPISSVNTLGGMTVDPGTGDVYALLDGDVVEYAAGDATPEPVYPDFCGGCYGAMAYDPAAEALYVIKPTGDDDGGTVYRIHDGRAKAILGVDSDAATSVSQPLDLAVDGAGNLFVADESGLVELDPDGNLTRPAGTADLDEPDALATNLDSAGGGDLIVDAGVGTLGWTPWRLSSRTPLSVGTVSVAGTPQPGATVTAAVDGDPLPAGAAYQYQWSLAGSDVDGATRGTFDVPANAAVGGAITVTVRAMCEGVCPAHHTPSALVESAPVAVVAAPEPPQGSNPAPPVSTQAPGATPPASTPAPAVTVAKPAPVARGHRAVVKVTGARPGSKVKVSTRHGKRVAKAKVGAGGKAKVKLSTKGLKPGKHTFRLTYTDRSGAVHTTTVTVKVKAHQHRSKHRKH